MWAYGCLAFRLLTGKEAFSNDENDDYISDNISKNKINGINELRKIDKDFILSLLNPDIKER